MWRMSMKEDLKIVQLRGTIFIQQNIGYTPDNASRFGGLLMSGGKVVGVPQQGIPFNGLNPNLPQFGMPWRIFSKNANGGEYNIVFSPGKIDVVQNFETQYGGNTEEEFCKYCIEKFAVILDELPGCTVQRIAYAPLYGLVYENFSVQSAIWTRILKNTVYDGIPYRDINLQYLVKKEITFGENTIQMNLLHNIFDGYNTVIQDGQQKLNKAVLLQLDINSIPEQTLSLDKEGVSAFFDNVTVTKNEIVDNVIS